MDVRGTETVAEGEAPFQHPRFRIIAKRGEGGFGSVYEAFDNERGFVVALKLLHRIGPRALEHFRREFRSLSELRHPNLPTLFDLFQHEGRWFFTMELVPGKRLLDYVSEGAEGPPTRDAPSLSVTCGDEPTSRTALTSSPFRHHPFRGFHESRLREALAQLTEVLDYIHSRGHVHCDVKPSNVLVRETGELYLLDFGLTNAFGSQGPFQGTPGYAAPEQILHEHVGPAADFYAAGTMLFEVLAGRKPFAGSEQQVLLDKVQFDPPDLSTLAPDQPADLVALCTQWLARDPKRRRPFAAPPLRQTPFVGRNEELRRLHEAHARARSGQQIVVIEGPSGVGKSTLLRHFLSSVERNASPSLPPLILKGRARDREHVSFNAFDGVADDLSLYAARYGERRAMTDLAAIFPTLRGTATGRATPVNRESGFHAMTQLLECGTGLPAILWLDDVQWGDLDSQALVRAICTAPSPPRCLIILTRRPAGGAFEIPVRTEHWALRALDQTETESLARELIMDRTIDEESVRAIARASSGLPLFVEELTRSPTLGNLPETLEASLESRLARLPTALQMILRVIALAATALEEGEIANAVGLSLLECSRLLEHLRYDRLVTVERIGAARGYVPYHDRIREIVSKRVGDVERRTLHANIARALEVSRQSRPALLAEHLVGAGDLERAARVVLAAATSAESVFAYEQAARLYEQARALRLPVGLSVAELMKKRALALEKAHLSTRAGEQYIELSEQAPTERERVQHLERACRLFLWSGELERGMAALEALFHRIGERLPKSQLAALAELAWEYSRPRDSEPPAEISQEAEERFLLLRSAAQGLGMTDNLRGAVLHARAFRIGRSSADRERSAEAFAQEAIFSGSSGAAGRKRAARLVARLDALYHPEMPSPHAAAWRSAALSVTEMQRAPTTEAAARLRETENLFLDLRDGNAWAISSLRIIRAMTLRIVGDLATLRTFVPEILRDAEHRNDRYAFATIGRGSQILWKADDTPEIGHRDLIRLTWPRLPGSFHFQEWIGLEGEAELALYEGNVNEFVRTHRRELWALRTAPFNVLVQSVRVLVMTLLGKLELARFEGGYTSSTLGARYYAERLMMEGVDYAKVRGELLRAGIAAATNRWADAQVHLLSVERTAFTSDSPYLGGVAAFLLGAMKEERSAPRVDEARSQRFPTDALSRVGVRRPPYVVRSEAPGFGSLLGIRTK